jgi:hypothetical protein
VTLTLSQAARRGRTVVLSLGVVYLLLGIVGFASIGFGEFGYEEPVRLLGVLGASTLLNIGHTFVGLVAGVAALRGAPSAFAAPATVAFTALTAFGVVSRVVPDSGDPLNQTWWNVILYALTAVACGYVYSLRLRSQPDE